MLKDKADMGKNVEISIVFPAYNEAEAIGKVLGSFVTATMDNGYEIIVVDDGSADGTTEIVKNYPIRLIKHSKNLGYGAALKTGIRNANGFYVVFCDADGQHCTSDILKVAELSKNYDVVISHRTKGSHVQHNRVLGKGFISLIASVLSGTKIPDINSGLRSFRKDVITKYLHLLPNGFSASTTSTLIVLKRKYNIHWTPIQTKPRIGKSSVKQVKHGIQTLLTIVRTITLFNPLKVFLPASIVLGIWGAGWSIIFWKGGFSIFGALLLLSALIIFFFGILCDQVSQMRLEKYE